MSEDTAVVETEGAEAASDDTPAVDPTIEARARKDGWLPQDEWKGDPKDWRDAAAFVKRGEEIDARLKPQLRKIERENAELRKTIDEFKDWMPKAEQRMYQRALKDIEAKMDNAAAIGDVDSYNAAKAEKAGLEQEVADAGKREPDKAPGQQVPNEVMEWRAENDWFDRDPRLAAWATAKHGELLVDKPGLSLADNLAEVTRLAKARFPEEFGITPQRKAPDVEPGGTRPRNGGNGRSYENLPPEAKAACTRFIKAGMIKDRAEYLANYEWD